MRNTCDISLKLGIQGVLPHHPAPPVDPPEADDMKGMDAGSSPAWHGMGSPGSARGGWHG